MSSDDGKACGVGCRVVAFSAGTGTEHQEAAARLIMYASWHNGAIVYTRYYRTWSGDAVLALGSEPSLPGSHRGLVSCATCQDSKVEGTSIPATWHSETPSEKPRTAPRAFAGACGLSHLQPHAASAKNRDARIRIAQAPQGRPVVAIATRPSLPFHHHPAPS